MTRIKRTKPFLLVAATILLNACSTNTNPVPEGYSGPLAMMADSNVRPSRESIDFFFLEQVDGKKVANSLGATIQANQGMGLSLVPKMVDRVIPATPATFTITGRTHYAAPILELAATVYQISGDVTFTPLPDHSYVVKGMLNEQYSGVWIEDTRYHTVVGKKIEVNGSTALGLLSK